MVRADPEISSVKDLEVNALEAMVVAGKAEKLVKIRSPRASMTYSKLPNLI